jgi:hypothetical protein
MRIGVRTGFAIVATTALLGAELASAHGSGFLGGTAPADVFREMAVVFGTDAAFSARVDVVRESGARPTRTQHLTYYLAPGKLRVDEDINETTGLPAGTTNRKKLGLDVQSRILHLDPPTTHLVFPRIEAYAAYPAATPASVQVEREAMGDDTVDGVPCLKQRIKLKGVGDVTEYTLWTRKDDPRIPVKIHDTAHDDVTATFHDVRWEAPPAAVFEIPKTYAGFESLRKVAEAERPIKTPAGAE